MSELSVRLAQVVPPLTAEHDVRARLEMIIQIVETGACPSGCRPAPVRGAPALHGRGAPQTYRDRRLTETLPQLKQAAMQSRSVLHVLAPHTLQARLAAGSRTAHLLDRIHGTTPSLR